MNKLLFFFLSALSIFSGQAFKECESDTMKELCESNTIDRCYECKNIELKSSNVCVPVFHNNIGTLDNYPVDKWNCTIFRNEDKSYEIIEDICLVDSIVKDFCHESEKNGFCMIANFINDICEQHNNKLADFKPLTYTSPWGPSSDCNQYFYKEICTNKVANFCFDCRKYLGKEFFTQKPRYHYYCSPFYKDMDEKEAVNWLSKEKYECKKWYNPNFNPSSLSVQNYETSRKLYPACTGPVCSKEGWTFKENHFGKEWCGLGKCKEFFGNRVLCDFPVNCGKNKNPNEHLIQNKFHKEFQTLGCGLEKFKCMLKKNCRNLIKQLEDCKDDQICMLTIVSQTDDEKFLELTKCILS